MPWWIFRHRTRLLDQVEKTVNQTAEMASRVRREQEEVLRRLRYLEIQAEVLARRHLSHEE